MDYEAVENQALLGEKIEQCRRLAGDQTDPNMRDALEQLAREYEAQRRRAASFMLRHKTSGEGEHAALGGSINH